VVSQHWGVWLALIAKGSNSRRRIYWRLKLSQHQISLLFQEFSLLCNLKFPVIPHVEFFPKPKKRLVSVRFQSLLLAKFSHFPCIFPCYWAFGAGDCVRTHCQRHHQKPGNLRLWREQTFSFIRLLARNAVTGAGAEHESVASAQWRRHQEFDLHIGPKGHNVDLPRATQGDAEIGDDVVPCFCVVNRP
jgi:hypothetical protein